MISADNHNITRLLLLTIIVSGKKCSMSIIDRQNIPINRQNRLIAHPYNTPYPKNLTKIHWLRYDNTVPLPNTMKIQTVRSVENFKNI